jgi:hypothetical protein
MKFLCDVLNRSACHSRILCKPRRANGVHAFAFAICIYKLPGLSAGLFSRSGNEETTLLLWLQLSYPDRWVPQFNGVAFGKLVRPLNGLLLIFTMQVVHGNDDAFRRQNIGPVFSHCETRNRRSSGSRKATQKAIDEAWLVDDLKPAAPSATCPSAFAKCRCTIERSWQGLRVAQAGC